MKLYQSLLTFTVSLYLVSWIPLCKASDECKRLSSLGKALKGHTFERFKANCPTDCIIRCEKELRCQSYNYVLEEKICELNNRTNEARPVDFKNDPARIYITIQFHRGRFIHRTKNPVTRPLFSVTGALGFLWGPQWGWFTKKTRGSFHKTSEEFSVSENSF